VRAIQNNHDSPETLIPAMLIFIKLFSFYLKSHTVVLAGTGKHRYNTNKSQNEGLVGGIIALAGNGLHICIYIVCVLVYNRAKNKRIGLIYSAISTQ
jgi:hypothetical protein